MLIKAVGRRLVEANPKGKSFKVQFAIQLTAYVSFPELAAGNIIRRILRLIREEYRAAAAAQVSAPPSTPGTPFLGPETPGLHFASSHYLSGELSFTSPPSSSTSLPRQPSLLPSLSNFVVMRHASRAQLERSGSLVDLSASTSSLFTSPTRGNLMDSLNGMNGIAPMSRGDSEEFMKQSSKLKPVFIQAIDEVVGELETTHEDVAKGAKEHVHST